MGRGYIEVFETQILPNRVGSNETYRLVSPIHFSRENFCSVSRRSNFQQTQFGNRKFLSQSLVLSFDCSRHHNFGTDFSFTKNFTFNFCRKSRYTGCLLQCVLSRPCCESFVGELQMKNLPRSASTSTHLDNLEP